jgi:anti-anti-sigma factor
MEVDMFQPLIRSSSPVHRAAGPLPGFSCTLRDSGLDAAWVRAAGELDIATAPQLEQTLRQAEARARRVVLDLRELTFMDSCGLHAIVDASIRARAAGNRLVLVRGPSQVDRLIVLSKAADVLEIVDLDPAQPPVQALVELAPKDRVA